MPPNLHLQGRVVLIETNCPDLKFLDPDTGRAKSTLSLAQSGGHAASSSAAMAEGGFADGEWVGVSEHID